MEEGKGITVEEKAIKFKDLPLRHWFVFESSLKGLTCHWDCRKTSPHKYDYIDGRVLYNTQVGSTDVKVVDTTSHGSKVILNLSQDYRDYSISHNTLRTEDLVDAAMDFLSSAVEEEWAIFAGPEYLVGVREELTKIRTEKVRVFRDTHMAVYYHELLATLLNKIAPNGCYFGSHPGNSSDIGFWSEEEED
jgi:hypothetical protein